MIREYSNQLATTKKSLLYEIQNLQDLDEVTIIPLSQTQICWNKSKYDERTDTYDPVTNK